MKWIVMTLAVALVSAAMLAGCEAQEEPVVAPAPAPPSTDEVSPDAPATGPATQTASLTASNEYCAVMAEHKADPKVTLAHAGKTIGFCCEDCIPTFQKEPAKYLGR